MKKLILILLVLSFGAQASLLNGVWEMTSRVCSDRSQPNDRMSTEGGSMFLTISGSLGIQSLSVGLSRYSSLSTVSESNGEITSNVDGEEVITKFKLLSSNQMKLIIEDFEEGGSCPVNTKMFITLERL